MKIFVSGVTGFLGDTLVKKLINRGHEIGCFVRNVSRGDKADNTESLIQGSKKSGTSYYFGDLTDFFAIRNSLREFQPSVIVHLASQTSVAYSFSHPFEIMHTNLVGTMNMAIAASEEVPHLKNFIWSGSAEEYGNQTEFPIKETSQLVAASPYGVAKIGSEKYLRYMYEAHGFPVIIFRNANSYGRLHNHQFIIESMIYQMLRQKEARFGDPSPIRDFIYNEDLLDAYIMAAESDSDKILGESINVSLGVGIKIEDLAKKIAEKTNFHGEIKWNCFPKRALEIHNLTMDNSKAKSLLNWKPNYTLDMGLDKTIDWWKHQES